MLGDLSVTTCDETDASKWDMNITVADNKITNIPVEYTGATGIFVGYVQSASIEHNLISNLTYSAMTVGWGWGRTGCGRGDNHIVGNRIENANMARCCDGGEVYTLGPQPGSTVERNYLVNHVPKGAISPYYGNAVYHDNGSGGFTDSHNVLDGTFAHSCGLNPPSGPFGLGRKCPGNHGEQMDCSIAFVDNWLRTTEVQHEQCSNGGNVTGNVRVVATEPLPLEAAAIAAASGPRISTRKPTKIFV